MMSSFDTDDLTVFNKSLRFTSEDANKSNIFFKKRCLSCRKKESTYILFRIKRIGIVYLLANLARVVVGNYGNFGYS